MSLKDMVRKRERKREVIPMASHRYHKKNKNEIKNKKIRRNKTRTSGCGLFVGTYFPPATSINRLHLFGWLVFVIVLLF